MIVTGLYVAAGVLAVLIPVVACAKYLEWRAWDNDRRIGRLRTRRVKEWARDMIEELPR